MPLEELRQVILICGFLTKITDQPVIKCGFLYHKNLEVSRIKSIAETSNLISSPAASLDRIEIKYDQHGIVVISPKDKVAFAKDLLEINPNIIDKITL